MEARSRSCTQRLETSGGHSRPGWRLFRQLMVASDMEDVRQRTVVVDSARDLQALSPYMTRTLRIRSR